MTNEENLTTEDVKMDWSLSQMDPEAWYKTTIQDTEIQDAAFDRWLAEVEAKATAKEQERIIKLIEEEVRYDFPPIIEMSLDSFMALIKGDQK
jgi:hypothetical protein